MLVTVWRGDLQLGLTQQFINELDVEALDLTGIGWLRPGETLTFADEHGGVEVEFVELRRWVGFQVSARPQLVWLTIAGAMLSVGLITALYAYRRRIWVVVDGTDGDGRTLYRVVGRAFQRPDVAEEEHSRIASAIADELDSGSTEAENPTQAVLET
jgi:cytochrome c biogenesis protein ResB